MAPKIQSQPEIPVLDRDNRGSIPRLDMSLKISSFYSQLDPLNWDGSIEHTTKRLGSVFRTAMEYGASITIDMEQYYLKDLTIAIFKNILEKHTDFLFGGIVMQAYLHDSEHDLQQLIDWAKTNKRTVTVRLAKGAYWDYETVVNPRKGWPIPVLMSKPETDRNYEKLTKMLLENSDYLRPAIATHNIRSISHAIAVAETLQLPKNAIEFQVIYGMAEPIRRVLQEMGYRVRAYAPVGELIPGMAYLIRRLLENTFQRVFSQEIFCRRRNHSQISLGNPAGYFRRLRTGFVEEGFRNEPVT